MDGESLDQGVEDPGCDRIEVLLQNAAAARHPGIGDFPEVGVPGGQRVELVGEHQVALAGEDVADDRQRDSLLGLLEITGQLIRAAN